MRYRLSRTANRTAHVRCSSANHDRREVWSPADRRIWTEQVTPWIWNVVRLRHPEPPQSYNPSPLFLSPPTSAGSRETYRLRIDGSGPNQ